MATDPGRALTLTLALTYQTARDCPDGLVPTPCLRCGAPLDVHQPDAGLPDRMLATCDGCRAWHLIDCDPQAGPVLVVLLPDADPFRAALRDRPPRRSRRTDPNPDR